MFAGKSLRKLQELKFVSKLHTIKRNCNDRYKERKVAVVPFFPSFLGRADVFSSVGPGWAYCDRQITGKTFLDKSVCLVNLWR